MSAGHLYMRIRRSSGGGLYVPLRCLPQEWLRGHSPRSNELSGSGTEQLVEAGADLLVLLVHKARDTTAQAHDLAMFPVSLDRHDDDREEAGQLDQPVRDHDPREALERHLRVSLPPWPRPGKAYQGGDTAR